MKLTGSPAEIIARIENVAPDVRKALEGARRLVPRGNKEIYEYQAACLYYLVEQYVKPGDTIIELGTYYGYTAAIMALAARWANIITLNVLSWEVDAAIKNLSILKNVSCVLQNSREYLDIYAGQPPALVFVDGDHKRARDDFPWFDKLRPGGLMLFHDYSPEGTPRACPPVYNAVNDFCASLGKSEPDILIVDNSGVGMAGIVR